MRFIKQKTFDGLIDKKSLRFDFYLPDSNTVIEYNGRQHYEPIAFFGGEKTYLKQVKHDTMKREYCTEHNIRVLDIPYTVKTREGFEEALRNAGVIS